MLVRVPHFNPEAWEACRPLDEHERIELYLLARARVEARRARAERAAMRDALPESDYEPAAACG